MRLVGIHYTRWGPGAETDVPSLVQKAKHLGYDQLEVDGIVFLKMNPWARKRLEFEARNHQLDISYSLTPPASWDLCSTDEHVRKHAIAKFTELITAIGQMGGGSLNGPLFAASLPDPPQQLLLSIKSLQAFAPLALEEEVELNFRPVKGSLLSTSQEVLAFVQALNQPCCGVNLDTYELVRSGESSVEAIKQAGCYLRCLHVREADKRRVGSGTIDWEAIGLALDTIYYKGPIVHQPDQSEEQQTGDEARLLRTLLCDTAP